MIKTLNNLKWPAMNCWTMRHVYVAAGKQGGPN
jgi:hypothetical protein